MPSLKESMEALGLVYNPELAKFNKASEEIARMLGTEDEYNRQKKECESPIKALARFSG